MNVKSQLKPVFAKAVENADMDQIRKLLSDASQLLNDELDKNVRATSLLPVLIVQSLRTVFVWLMFDLELSVLDWRICLGFGKPSGLE